MTAPSRFAVARLSPRRYAVVEVSTINGLREDEPKRHHTVNVISKPMNRADAYGLLRAKWIEEGAIYR